MKVNVLGAEYSFITDSDYLKKINADGVCKEYDKEIVIKAPTDYLEADASSDAKVLRRREVIRHEIIHAFFGESGLEEYNSDEQLVNWLAVQFPKILKAFEEVNAV